MRILPLILLCFLPSAPLSAQAESQENEAAEAQAAANPMGEVPGSSSGAIGQRRGRDAVQAISPTARISNRIQNRVRTRLRTRIDRYGSQQDPDASFSAAEEEVRGAGRPPR